MREVGQTVDHRAGAIAGQVDGGLVLKRANDDHVGILAEHAAEVGHAFARAETDVVAQKQAVAPQVDHARLETDAGAQRGFFEQQGHHAAGQQRFAQTLVELGFQIFADGENAIDLGRFQIGHGKQVSHVVDSLRSSAR